MSKYAGTVDNADLKCGVLACMTPYNSTTIPVNMIGKLARKASWIGLNYTGSRFACCSKCKRRPEVNQHVQKWFLIKR